MTPNRVERICAWVAFVAIVLGVAAGNTHNFKVRLLPDDLNSPILAMELLRSPDQLAQVVGDPSDPKNNRKDMAMLTKIDFAFIAAYSCLFLSVSLRLRQRSHRWTAILLIAVVIPAAVFDVRENLAIFRTLDCLCTTPRAPSLTKWTLIFIALLLVAPVFVDSTLKPLRRTIGYLAAALCVTAAFIGLAGVSLGVDPLIERGATFMGLGLLAGWLFFATRSVLSNGFVAALDRLAEVRGFKQLSTWPSDES
jgi:hypothetical protein